MDRYVGACRETFGNLTINPSLVISAKVTASKSQAMYGSSHDHRKIINRYIFITFFVKVQTLSITPVVLCVFKLHDNISASYPLAGNC